MPLPRAGVVKKDLRAYFFTVGASGCPANCRLSGSM
jgi:hypothetical protein